MRVLLSAVVLLTIVSVPASAAENIDYVLLPVGPGTVRGAFGSEWVTQLTISNTSGTPVRVFRFPPCELACSPQPLPGGTTTVEEMPWPVGPMLAWVEKGRVSDVAFTLRARDTSRQFETWGTVVPLVHPDQFFGRTFSLVDIPMESQFRATLRIYHVNASKVPSMRVRFYDTDPGWIARRPDPLIAELEPLFSGPESSPSLGTAGFPGVAEIPLWLDPELVKHTNIRIELAPLDGSPDYWALVSVTHNTTQHVTVILP